MQAARLRYLDMMKGVAIFLVVMGHVITMCVREIDRTPLFKFIEQIHMPLFFFISGWLSYKENSNGLIKSLSLYNKGVRLLLPMAAVSSLWIFYFPHSGLQSPLNSTFEGLWSDSWKNGYWFTLVLFEIFLVYQLIIPVMNRWRTATGNVTTISITWLSLIILTGVIPSNVASYISLQLVTSFFPAFMFGWLCNRYRENFLKAMRSNMCQFAALVLLSVSLYVCSWPWELGLSDFSVMFVQTLLHISLAFVAFPIFEHWNRTVEGQPQSSLGNSIANTWSYIGNQSLGIYLLHYFFLFPMGDLFRTSLLSVNLSLVPVLLFSAFWTACIVAVVLIVIRIIKNSRTLSLILGCG